ncbi:hypothetical protein IWQ62_000271 [Dispira parvispora]|uniref:PCI domain-containing protein n=1 Tax=Dispira parvispora TaxID=1520584 RepID=A0A9W8B115_9FUNG|nr:hypothetical protein IWQ62_000271 [Dispira parvispora]
MSDDDFMFDDVDYDYDYDNSDGNMTDLGFALEEAYNEAKSLRESDMVAAIAKFHQVLEDESEPGEWGVKAAKQLVRIYLQRAGGETEEKGELLREYRGLLGYLEYPATRSDAEKTFNDLLDQVTKSDGQAEWVEDMYRVTLEVLNQPNYERLWIKTQLRLGKFWLNRGDYPKLYQVTRQLHQVCDPTDGESPDHLKSNYLMETYALEIQLYTAIDQLQNLKSIYHQCIKLQSAISHPQIMGVVYECGGKLHLVEGNWTQAQTDLFEAFKNYDEAGDHRRIKVLKYLALAGMLSHSSIDLLDSPETRPYRNHPEIIDINRLAQAYQDKDYTRFRTVISQSQDTLLSDPFIAERIDVIAHSLIRYELKQTLGAYRRITLHRLACQTGLTLETVQALVTEMIIDGEVSGTIDQELREYVANDEQSEAQMSLTELLANLLQFANK